MKISRLLTVISLAVTLVLCTAACGDMNSGKVSSPDGSSQSNSTVSDIISSIVSVMPNSVVSDINSVDSNIISAASDINSLAESNIVSDENR